MTLDSAHDLLVHDLKDIYFAEQQLLKTLPALEKNACTHEMQQLLSRHIAETEGHVLRLKQVFQMLGLPARGEVCPGMLGLLQEHQQFMEEEPSVEAQTLFDIGSSIKVELYEIAAYEGIIQLARSLEQFAIADLLTETLVEETRMLDNLKRMGAEYADPSFLFELSGETLGA
jgi:ferritin-like metal-binding protein YciE